MTLKQEISRLTDEINKLCDNQRQLFEWAKSLRVQIKNNHEELLGKFQLKDHRKQSRKSKRTINNMFKDLPGI